MRVVAADWDCRADSPLVHLPVCPSSTYAGRRHQIASEIRSFTFFISDVATLTVHTHIYIYVVHEGGTFVDFLSVSPINMTAGYADTPP